MSETKTKTVYYDVHVFHSRNDGFSVPIKSEQGEMADEDVINLALKQGAFCTEDARSVDYVEEIDEETYNTMKGI
jgi:hypothetical protein